jgi:myo-inositol 2-dehydrogenase/D-chiro-inositol 1-dehydrogenase
MGRTHINALSDSNLAKITAVVDPSSQALQAVESAGVSTYRDLDPMLAAREVDAVIVSVPTTLHFSTVSQLIDARVPVLVEKPFGLNSSMKERAVVKRLSEVR